MKTGHTALKSQQAKQNQGFTLIEIMITIAILAIIVAIAVPSYTRFVIKSNRAEGKAITMQTAQTLERCFTRFSSYDNAGCGVGDGAPVTSENEKYTITIEDGDITATTFTLTATPTPARPEDKCLALTLTHTGVRGVSGTDPVADCW